jgi:hypothetical protein
VPDLTYYVALPFLLSEEGELVAGEARECQTARGAVREARRLALACAGAVAFSRSGDPASGEFADAVVIESFGSVPATEMLLRE